MWNAVIDVENKKSFLRKATNTLVHIKLSNDTSKTELELLRFLDHFLSLTSLQTVFSLVSKFATSVQQEQNKLLAHNLRGRPVETFQHDEIHKLGQGEEEVFFISGVCFSTDQTDDEKQESLPFSLQVKSRFAKFSNSSDICYEIVSIPHGPITSLYPEVLHLKLSQLVPFRIDIVRIGVEVFRKKFLGSIFGRLPVIKKRFYLSAYRSSIELILEEEDLSSKIKIPFSEEEIPQSLDRALDKAGIYRDLLQTITGKL